MEQTSPQPRRVQAAEMAKALCNEARFTIGYEKSQPQTLGLSEFVTDIGTKYFALNAPPTPLAEKFAARTNEAIERRSGVREPYRKLVSLQKALEKMGDESSMVDVQAIREGRTALEAIRERASERTEQERSEMTIANMEKRTHAFNASRKPGEHLVSLTAVQEAQAPMFRKHHYRERALDQLGKQVDAIIRTLAIEPPERKPVSTQRIF